MNKIEEHLKKFETIKQKIPNTDVTFLIKERGPSFNTLLKYLVKKKNNTSTKKQANNIFTSNHIITENPPEQRQKEKNKFITQKQDDKGKSKTQQGKNHGNSNEQGSNNKGNANKNIDSSFSKLTLLKIENDNMARPELKKIFEKTREEEEKINREKKINQEKEAEKEEKQPEKEKEKENEEMKDMSIDEDEKEKKEEPKDEKEIIMDNNPNCGGLILRNMESGIDIPNNFNIFDDYKLKEEEYDKDDNFRNYNNEEGNRESSEKNDDNKIKFKNNPEKANDDIKDTIQEEKEKKKEKEEQKNLLADNENRSNNLKICISLDEEGEKEKEDIKPLSENKNPKLNSNKKNIPKKILQNKTKRNISKEIKKNNNTNTNKGENYLTVLKNGIASKSKNKVITDDDEEEYKLKAKMIETTTSNKKSDEKLFLKTEGSKIKLLLDPDDLKNIKENDLNNNNKITKKDNPQNDKKINVELETVNKNNKNLINKNKNKNGSQNNAMKNNIIYNNYDLSCLDNIHDILIQIEERLNKENMEKNKIKSCFELIDYIKKNDVNINNNNLIKRKKDTYINVFKILRILFKYFSDKKIAKNYKNEMVAILTIVENYYKSVKKNDNLINDIDFYNKRKIAFKYVYSKLELKNCEKDNLKKLYALDKNNDDNSNNIITDSKNAIKFIKTFKRYTKTSTIMNQELKKLNDKLNNNPKTNNIKEFLDKYEYCGADIQMSPHLMGYNRLFSHFFLIFSFYQDSRNLLNEIEEPQKKKDMNHVNDMRKKGKSVQVNKNGLKEKRDSSLNNVKMKK